MSETNHDLSAPRSLTSVSIWLAMGWAVLGTALIYGIAFTCKSSGNPLHVIYVYLYERSWVQYVSTYAFCTAIAILILKTFRIKSQRAAFSEVEEQVFKKIESDSTRHKDNSKTTAITQSSVNSIMERLKKVDLKYQDSMLVVRLENACRRLANTQSASDVDNIHQMLAESDAALIDTSYTAVKFLYALIPLLGFLGNVLGVGGGIAEFSSVLETAQSFDGVRQPLKNSATALANAFDTTFLALAYSAVVLLLNAVIQQSEEMLLVRVDEYCLEKFVSRIRVETSDLADFKSFLASFVHNIIHNVDASILSVTKSVEPIPSKIDQAVQYLESIERELSSKTRQGGHYSELERLTGDILTLLNANVVPINNSLQSISEQQIQIRESLDKLIDQNAVPLDELKGLTTALEQVVDRMANLENAADAFKLVGEMSSTFGELHAILIDLKPAIDSMSTEMAKEINSILGKLLRATIVAHNWHKFMPQEVLEGLQDKELMERIFR